MITIQKSVGSGGANLRADVTAVQTQLNLAMSLLVPLAPPPINGVADDKTVLVIKEFQRRVVGLPRPDGRIDPGGTTLQALNLAGTGFLGIGVTVADAVAGAAKAALSVLPGSAAKVTYSDDMATEKRLVDPYSIKVVERALAISGVSAAVITSTIRTPHDQARIMYPNAKKNLQAQYDMYGNAADQMLDVFAANKDKPEATVIALMAQKADDLLKKGIRPSNHMYTAAEYAKFNVFDIGMNSTRAVAGSTFNVSKLTAAFKQLHTEGYIKKFIDETKKSNHCWHLEIVPNAKALP